MKKLYLLLITLFAFASAIAQTLVSTTPGPRNAVLEEFTGVNCPNCPDGHVRAEALFNAHPGRVVWINIHSGSFAIPQTGQLDLRTPFGNSIDSMAGVAAYPSGTMNRTVWPGAYNVPPYYPQNPPNRLAIRRPGWWEASLPGQGAGEYIILNGGLSPVNVGAQSFWNATTRDLTINVELYYTSDDSSVTNQLNVVFAESNVYGYQSGGGSNYNHRHIMRNMITGLWGEQITGVAQNLFVQRTYVYNVPVAYNIDNCELSIFVTRDNPKHTHTGVVFPAKNGSTVGVNDIENNIGFAVYPNPTDASSIISYSLAEANETSFELFSVLGNKIASADMGFVSEGIHEISLNEITDMNRLASGIYFLQLKSGNATEQIKVVKE